MPTVVFVDDREQLQTAHAPQGGSFSKLCDTVNSPVPFHCRRATCGTCRIAVLEGIEELMPADDHELRLLEVFGLSARTHRLACQALMRPGDAMLRVRPLEKRAPPRYTLWIPVTFDGTSKQLACTTDTRLGDVRVTGTTELRAHEVVVVTYRSPVDRKLHDVVGRVLRAEPSGDGNDGTQRHRVAIEFLESDEMLATVFEAVSTEALLASKPGGQQ